jgi:hypothetical protein
VRRHHLVCGALALTTAACGAGWHQPARLTPGPWPIRQQVQVWSERQALRWHAVVVRQDSISGVPFLTAHACDSCRRTLPLAVVDSVRVGRPVAGFWKTVGLVIGLPLAAIMVLCEGEACIPET